MVHIWIWNLRKQVSQRMKIINILLKKKVKTVPVAGVHLAVGRHLCFYFVFVIFVSYNRSLDRNKLPVSGLPFRKATFVLPTCSGFISSLSLIFISIPMAIDLISFFIVSTLSLPKRIRLHMIYQPCSMASKWSILDWKKSEFDGFISLYEEDSAELAFDNGPTKSLLSSRLELPMCLINGESRSLWSICLGLSERRLPSEYKL